MAARTRKSSKEMTKDVIEENHYCFVCGVSFGAEDQLFCIMCVDAGIVVIGDGGTPIKHGTPIVQVFFCILFSFLLGVVIGNENLHSFIMWAIFGDHEL
jgi:hypothetical protein